MEMNRTYKLLSGETVQSAAYALAEWLDREKGMITQTMRSKKGYIVECKGDAAAEWTKYIGADAALSIDLSQFNDELEVTIFVEKLREKAGIAAVGAIFLHPLLVTSAVGGLRQMVLMSDIFNWIEKNLAVEMVKEEPPTRTTNTFQTICPSCGAVNKEGSHYCRSCGASLIQEKVCCPTCGETLDGDEAFCPHCGTKL
ncbi:MAG: zinc ribbon domain-containing protein [Solobacterium sp.]|nr:zinc ribbon domain-containing protein [Solobacterium sp.]